MKRIFLLGTIFMFLFCGTVSAKTIGLNLLVGGVYTNHQLHNSSEQNSYGFSTWTIWSKHMGGFNVGLFYDLPKNWSLYLNTQFSFNKIFVNDTQAGFGYNFKPGKGFNMFLGGGFAFGGSKHRISNTKSHEYGNIGGGIAFIPSFMFSNKLGMYMGVMGSIYKPVSSKVVTKTNNKYTRENNYLRRMASSINVMLGLKIIF